MKIGAAFPSKYLKADDLGTARPVVTIERVTLEDVGGDGEHRPVIRFAGKDKALVCNRTNANIITEVLGSDDTDDWVGQSIRLYATKTEFQGKRVPCIRVDDQPVKTAAKRQPEPESFDDDEEDEPAPKPKKRATVVASDDLGDPIPF